MNLTGQESYQEQIDTNMEVEKKPVYKVGCNLVICLLFILWFLICQGQSFRQTAFEFILWLMTVSIRRTPSSIPITPTSSVKSITISKKSWRKNIISYDYKWLIHNIVKIWTTGFKINRKSTKSTNKKKMNACIDKLEKELNKVTNKIFQKWDI